MDKVDHFTAVTPYGAAQPTGEGENPGFTIPGQPESQAQLTGTDRQTDGEGENAADTIGRQGSSSSTSSAKNNIQHSNSLASVEVVQRFQDAKAYGRARLLRLRGPSLSSSSVLLVVGFALYFTSANFSVMHELGYGIACLAVFVMLLSLLPSDKRCIRICTIAFGLPATILFTLNILAHMLKDLSTLRSGDCKSDAHTIDCDYMYGSIILNIYLGMIFLTDTTWLFWGLCRQKPCDLLQTLWRVLGFGMMGLGSFNMVKAFAAFALGFYTTGVGYSLRVVGQLAVGSASFHSRFIRHVQSWLMSRGEAATTAASIANCLGGRDSEEILAEARRSFRFVSADKLTREDMAENTPNPALGALAERGKLGHVDAFVSHSWSDDPKKKWDALQVWREEFKKHHKGREPKLWIDKYSLDQSSIEDSLACLPVYLAGCNKLLVLVGNTYLKRLWCLVELFVFLEMGGQPSTLDVRLLEAQNVPEVLGEQRTSGRSSGRFSDRFSGRFSEISSRFSDRFSGQVSKDSLGILCFDARQARCFTDEDTNRLHEVIAATGHGAITELVRNVFLATSKANTP